MLKSISIHNKWYYIYIYSDETGYKLIECNDDMNLILSVARVKYITIPTSSLLL